MKWRPKVFSVNDVERRIIQSWSVMVTYLRSKATGHYWPSGRFWTRSTWRGAPGKECRVIQQIFTSVVFTLAILSFNFFDTLEQIGFSKIPKGKKNVFSARFICIFFSRLGFFPCDFSNFLLLTPPQFLLDMKRFRAYRTLFGFRHYATGDINQVMFSKKFRENYFPQFFVFFFAILQLGKKRCSNLVRILSGIFRHCKIDEVWTKVAFCTYKILYFLEPWVGCRIGPFPVWWLKI